MDKIFEFFYNCVTHVFTLLNNIYFNIYSVRVSFLGIVLAVMIFTFIIAVFWKGAKQ